VFADDPGIGGTIVSEKWFSPVELRKIRTTRWVSGEVHEPGSGFEKLRHVEVSRHVPQVFVPEGIKQSHAAIALRWASFLKGGQFAPKVVRAGPVGVLDAARLGGWGGKNQYCS